MNPTLWPLLHLQGDIKVYLMSTGIDHDAAHLRAADLLDLIAKSPVIKPELAAAYAELSADQ